MTAEIIKLKVRPSFRGCPECGHIATQIEIDSSVIDFDCSGCGNVKQSEYIRRELPRDSDISFD